jgi:hypothetical protein
VANHGTLSRRWRRAFSSRLLNALHAQEQSNTQPIQMLCSLS